MRLSLAAGLPPDAPSRRTWSHPVPAGSGRFAMTLPRFLPRRLQVLGPGYRLQPRRFQPRQREPARAAFRDQRPKGTPGRNFPQVRFLPGAFTASLCGERFSASRSPRSRRCCLNSCPNLRLVTGRNNPMFVDDPARHLAP